MYNILKDVYKYRYFILGSIWNDFYVRFVRSKLGGAWLVLQPLSQVLIYALILSNLLSSRIPEIDNTYGYAIYLMSGLLAWNLFSEIIDRCLKIFVSNANVIKKVNFPKVTLPLISIGCSIFNNFILFVVMIIIFFTLGHKININIIYLFLLFPCVVIFSSGIGLLLGVINVFIRDLEQVVPIILQVMFWFTPIVYPDSVIPEKYLGYLALNPMMHIVSGYHNVIAHGKVPSLIGVSATAALGLIICLLAFYMFRRASAEMVDVL